jgi:hypothetical protein
MRVITLLFVLFSTFSFAQTRFRVAFSNTTVQGKETISQIENHIPDTYDRMVEEQAISFSTVVDYEIAFVRSVLAICNVPDAIITKEKTGNQASEKAGGTNCEQAMQLCSSSSVPGNSGGFGTQELPNNNSIDGCLSVEHQSSWYYLNVLTPGNLVMRVNPDDNDDDYDFAIWGPFTAANAGANCPPITAPIRCSYSEEDGNTGMAYGAGDNSENSGGDAWVNPLPVSTSQIYILLVDNFSTSNDGYNIEFNFSGNLSTAVLGCIPVTLPVGISAFSGEKKYGENRLSWTSESETNNNYYSLESSVTGKEYDWTEVEKVQGAGNSTEHLTYTVSDTRFTKGAVNYYRLIQTDYDGKTTVIEKKVAIDNRTEAKGIAKVINLLGQEVSENERGIVILIFEDGTQEKRFNN